MSLNRMTWFVWKRRVNLRSGDLAPDFTLPGSDGHTYHLRDILDQGYGVVMAWFPKAFTGG
jgi:peroxiredoxin Q/BCP